MSTAQQRMEEMSALRTRNTMPPISDAYGIDDAFQRRTREPEAYLAAAFDHFLMEGV